MVDIYKKNNLKIYQKYENEYIYYMSIDMKHSISACHQWPSESKTKSHSKTFALLLLLINLHNYNPSFLGIPSTTHSFVVSTLHSAEASRYPSLPFLFPFFNIVKCDLLRWALCFLNMLLNFDSSPLLSPHSLLILHCRRIAWFDACYDHHSWESAKAKNL